jgi:hypothetical protein
MKDFSWMVGGFTGYICLNYISIAHSGTTTCQGNYDYRN